MAAFTRKVVQPVEIGAATTLFTAGTDGVTQIVELTLRNNGPSAAMVSVYQVPAGQSPSDTLNRMAAPSIAAGGDKRVREGAFLAPGAALMLSTVGADVIATASYVEIA